MLVVQTRSVAAIQPSLEKAQDDGLPKICLGFMDCLFRTRSRVSSYI